MQCDDKGAFIVLEWKSTVSHCKVHPYRTCTPSPHQTSIWHWAVARLLLVLWEHDVEIIRHAHDLSTDDEVRLASAHFSI